MSGYDSMEQPSPDVGGGNLSRHAENQRDLGETIENVYDESDRKANGHGRSRRAYYRAAVEADGRCRGRFGAAGDGGAGPSARGDALRRSRDQAPGVGLQVDRPLRR